MDQRLYQLGLHLTPGLGGVLIRYLIAHFGDAQKVFEANYKTLIRVTGVGEAIARTVLQKEGLRAAEVELRKLGSYVSLVGTRKATDYGRNITEQIVEGLVNHDVTIVSGLAYGIDIAAHRASVRSQIPTIGVMATGVDVIYPEGHIKTAREMEINGGIVTEYCLGTKPDSMRFPARNRIIAGLSDAVIVVESAKKGGGLLTAEFANNYNRDVFAVPGNLSNPYSIGPNNLISANKAQIFTGVENLLESLSWLTSKASVKATLPDHFTQEESQIVALLRQRGEMHIDNLTWESQVSTGKLATLLLNLELQGYIRSLPGKRYALG